MSSLSVLIINPVSTRMVFRRDLLDDLADLPEWNRQPGSEHWMTPWLLHYNGR
jgi:hypothetical protein